MGIVLHQSFKNTLIIFVGFTLGGINVLFLYTHFLEAQYFGLVTFLLSASNLLMPLFIFGMQHTIIKFYSSYKNKVDRDNFLFSALILPLLIIIPLGILGVIFYESISDLLSSENIIIKKYSYLIFIIAVLMGYFEVFYAWSKVQMKSVFGNFIREIFGRLSVTCLLFSVHFEWLNSEEFIYGVVIVYALRTIIMKVYALWIYFPSKFSFRLPSNIVEILSYSFFIILAGSAGTILLEIDKFMIPQMEKIEQVAYYSVGVYIATVISIPSRAMQQIVNPITARELNNNNITNVESLYKKSSINLLIVGGLIFLLINVNIREIYELIDRPEYSIGIYIVLMVSTSELFKLSLGTNGAILTNSKYYRMFFYFSIAMALSVILLNKFFIDWFGIEGAAFATLVVVVVFGMIRIFYIKTKLKIQPYTQRTRIVMLLILFLFLTFYFVDLSINPLISIVLKSLLVSTLYMVSAVKFRLSEDINVLVRKYFF